MSLPEEKIVTNSENKRIEEKSVPTRTTNLLLEWVIYDHRILPPLIFQESLGLFPVNHYYRLLEN
jgi:hypothetical protein